MKSEAGVSGVYVHGANSLEQTRLLRRGAPSSAAFLLPHLQPGAVVLDCGCGVGSITCDLANLVAPGRAVGLDSQAEQVDRKTDRGQAESLRDHRELARDVKTLILSANSDCVIDELRRRHHFTRSERCQHFPGYPA